MKFVSTSMTLLTFFALFACSLGLSFTVSFLGHATHPHNSRFFSFFLDYSPRHILDAHLKMVYI